MKVRILKKHLLTTVCLLAALPVIAEPEWKVAADLLIEAKQLITDNCGDCHRGTREDLEQGIQKLEEVLSSGFGGKEGYLLLADGYRALSLVYDTPGSRQQEESTDRLRGAYRRLLELCPIDARNHYEYAMLLTDEPPRQVHHLREAIALEPDSLEAHMAFAEVMARLGRVEEASENVVWVLNHADPETLLRFRTRVSALVRRYGTAPEIALIDSLLGGSPE